MTPLESKIKDAAQKYYTDGSSPLTDAEFDALIEQLKAEQPDSELLTTGWGYSADVDNTGNKVKHKYGRAGSLTKVHSYSELPSGFVVRDASLKLDGLSTVLYYENGKYVQALTRGDGEVGIDITSKLKPLVPDKLNCEFTGAIRGEILMRYDKFSRFKEAHPDAKNPRNSAAGLINGKDMQADIEYYLDVVVYTIVGWENPTSSDIEDMLEQEDIRYSLCKIYPGTIVPYRTILDELDDNSFEKLMTDLKPEWYDMYPADGIVLTSDMYYDASTYQVNWNAVAYKYPNESVETTVEGVEWSLTKTGYLVPRVKIEPKFVDGSTINYCTGYNAKYIVDNKIGKGAVVTFSKHGMIIPNIDEVVSTPDENQFTYPDRCPVCNNKLTWQGVHLICNNLQCQNIQEQDILVWCDNIAPVDGLSDKIRLDIISQVRGEFGRATVDEMMQIARDKYNSLKALTSSPLTRGRVTLATEFWHKLCSVSDIPLVAALKALNIPRLGDKTAEKLAEYPELVQQLMGISSPKIDDTLYKELRNVIGDANTDSVLANRWKFKRLDYIASRIAWLSGRNIGAVKVAITGKLSIKRAEFEKALKAAGFIPGDISKDTKILITDDPTSNSSKNKKADAWGIEKLTEAEFKEKYLNI